ncbi:unnamed protein product, partial [Tilletia controversa]
PEDLREKPEEVLQHLLGISTQRHQNIREMMKAIKDGGADDPDAQKLFKLLKEDHEVTFQQMMAILHEIDATTLRLRV